MSWHGWLRVLVEGKAPKTEDAGWLRVCEGESWSECWDRLLRVKAKGTAIERVALPVGRHPERRRRPT
mgnify:CR=1 FL=1